MEVAGKSLTNPIIKGWLLELMEGGREYEINELVDLVHESHAVAGGLPTEVQRPRQQVSKALSELEDEGKVRKGRYSHWIADPDALPDF